jgi:hypothetical protein
VAVLWRKNKMTLTDGQQQLLKLLNHKLLGETLPEMYPHNSGQTPALPVTFSELSALQKEGLVLFQDYIKNVDHSAYNAYLIQRGGNLERYEKNQH